MRSHHHEPKARAVSGVDTEPKAEGDNIEDVAPKGRDEAF
jgi:hypothetical protein